MKRRKLLKENAFPVNADLVLLFVDNLAACVEGRFEVQTYRLRVSFHEHDEWENAENG
jgi:hypothetical protein